MDSTLGDQLLDAWRINCRITNDLLAQLTDEQLEVKLASGKAVSGQFAHIHNVRRMWLKAIDAAAAESLPKLESGGVDRESIAGALLNSDASLAAAMATGIAAGKVRNFKPHPAAFVCYFIAHEANHRAQVELALRQAKLPVTTEQEYGQWEWGKL